MTNEELAVQIKAGDRERAGELWDRVKLFVCMLCNRFYALYADACRSAGVDADDLCQEGYFALMDAVEAYDPAGKYKLLTYIRYPLLNRLNALVGFRGRRRLHNAPVSLDEPTGDGIYLGDTLADQAAEDELEAVIEQVYTEGLRADLDYCLATLDPRQREAIRAKYFDSQPIHGAGEHLYKGLQRLKSGRCMNRLRKYEQDLISRYAYNSSYRLWKETGYSSTEYTAMKLQARLKL
jgi:RNA polymerase sigma factor (sigma-70 family)